MDALCETSRKPFWHEDLTKRRFWEYEDKPFAELCDKKYEGIRGIRGAVIHDLGSPFDIKPDAYTWHNVKEWKDLAPKYILMVYRHYKMTGNIKVVENCWQAVEESIDYLKNLIVEGDELPLTRGTDDTFDNLSSHGISIYCASLWAAGLNAASELAKLVGKTELAEAYISQGQKSLALVERGLWDEKNGYFHFFVTPIQSVHLTGESFQDLETLGLTLTGDKCRDKEILNEYLDNAHYCGGGSKLKSRFAAKRLLADVAPQAFTDEFQKYWNWTLTTVSGMQCSPTVMTKLLGLGDLFESGKVERSLEYIYQTNFKRNSPKLGIANMTLSDGMPHDAFQAQDVWIGVQFSVATALRLAGKNVQAIDVLDTVYDALYHQAKIPFAAPEGFNCSVQVTTGELMNQFDIEADVATNWFENLIASGCLLVDGRVNPDICESTAEFADIAGSYVEQSYLDELHLWLKNTGLKYTAGRYFRPGMIFAYLNEAL
ncbi:GH116 family glycosyl hydrolase [Vibrio hannami]|uniref:GH116 family glycosyl hydrolase n=1 Tax=Vibrio hannami TaxID=2717094 RepID=UPI00240FEBB5|nr:GH116 family glycosyl hydrolase [Vibrio hannami]MDG3085683.1 GH116 family glycosyl hydrolase [Vibrio hannami]